MRKIFKPHRQGEKGFTLIELLVVVALLGVMAAIAIPNVIQFIGRGEEESKQTEHDNIQTAVLALLSDAGVHELDGDYTNIRVKSDVEGVTAGEAPDNHSLDEYLYIMGDEFPLTQAYDIDKSGLVTVSST